MFSPEIVLHKTYSPYLCYVLGTMLWKIKSQLNMTCGFQKYTIKASEQNELM